MSFRPQRLATAPAAPPHYGALAGYETGTGFALTHGGAIGFSQEVEEKLAANHFAKAMSASVAAATSAPSAAAAFAQPTAAVAAVPVIAVGSGGVMSNRDAYARMNITCESLVDPPSKTRKKLKKTVLQRDESSDEEHMGSGLFGGNGFKGMVTGTRGETHTALDRLSKDRKAYGYTNDHIKRLNAIVRNHRIFEIYKQNRPPTNKKSSPKFRIPDVFQALELSNRTTSESVQLNKHVQKIFSVWGVLKSVLPVTIQARLPKEKDMNLWHETSAKKGDTMYERLKAVSDAYQAAVDFIAEHNYLRRKKGINPHAELFNHGTDVSTTTHIMTGTVNNKKKKSVKTQDKQTVTQAFSHEIKRTQEELDNIKSEMQKRDAEMQELVQRSFRQHVSSSIPQEMKHMQEEMQMIQDQLAIQITATEKAVKASKSAVLEVKKTNGHVHDLENAVEKVSNAVERSANTGVGNDNQTLHISEPEAPSGEAPLNWDGSRKFKTTSTKLRATPIASEKYCTCAHPIPAPVDRRSAQTASSLEEIPAKSRPMKVVPMASAQRRVVSKAPTY